MKEDIRCTTCPMMKMTGHARFTGNNDHMARPGATAYAITQTPIPPLS